MDHKYNDRLTFKTESETDLHTKLVSFSKKRFPNSIFNLIKELGLDNCSTPTGNSTYTSCQMSSEDIVNTHDTFMKSLGIELSDDDKKLPYLY